MDRVYWFSDTFDRLPEYIVQYTVPGKEDLEWSTREDANLSSSLLRDGTHAPAIDIDLPSELSEDGTLNVQIDPYYQFEEQNDPNYMCKVKAYLEGAALKLVEANFAKSVEILQQQSSKTFGIEIQLTQPASLVNSKTEGHHHLYVDGRYELAHYIDILRTLGELLIVEKAFVDATEKRGMSLLRLRNAMARSAQAALF